MHTAGEPVRIVTEGYPELSGQTILEKRRDALENHDHWRRMLMLEPRGHIDMYGVIPTKPCAPGADLAVLFTHNSGYSTMCGHATIAIGRWAVETGLVPWRGRSAQFKLECPCGLVDVIVERDESGQVQEVRFRSVPSFLSQRDLSVTVPNFGEVTFDIAYGGAFYAVLPASHMGLSIFETAVSDLLSAASLLTETIRQKIKVEHPEQGDLSFLYGTILTDDDCPARSDPSYNLCVFADGQIDRSPTGSGVTARMARDIARGLIEPGESRRFIGISGDSFTGRALEQSDRGVIVEVSGRSWFTGQSEFFIEPGDPLGGGFLLPETFSSLRRS
jgi:proline racemase